VTLTLRFTFLSESLPLKLFEIINFVLETIMTCLVEKLRLGLGFNLIFGFSYENNFASTLKTHQKWVRNCQKNIFAHFRTS